jgi:hypothetical protein
MLTVRGSVHALQCPRCVLRFASVSELEQHLQLDHQPPKAPAKAEPERIAIRRDDPPARPSADESARLNAFIVRLIGVAAVVAFVSVFSWRAAALITVAAFAGATLRNTIRARWRNKRVHP